MTTIKYVNVCLLIDLLTNLIIFTVPSVPLSSSRNWISFSNWFCCRTIQFVEHSRFSSRSNFRTCYFKSL